MDPSVEVSRLNKLLLEKQDIMDKMEEQSAADKMIHERTIRDLKKENELLMRENDSLKFRMEQLGDGSQKPGNFQANSKLTFRPSD